MFKLFTNFDKFSEELKKAGLKIDIKELTLLNYTFLQTYNKFTILSIIDYDEEPNHIIVFSSKNTFIYTKKNITKNRLKQFNSILNKKHGESTAVTFLVLRLVLNNYKSKFETIRSQLIQVEQTLEIDKIESEGIRLRNLVDRLEDFVDIVIQLEERELAEFDSNLITYDYNILTTESKYWLDRCRSNIYRIASLRTRCDVKSNSELNERITKLTIIMTFLTITSIVVSLPGTVGAIFGIPALSDAYFKGHNLLLVNTLIIVTMVSIVFGYLYWKGLRLKM